MFTHCDSLRVALSVTLRLTHIFSRRSPCSSCFSCRPLRLMSFPLPLAAFWCSRYALPFSLLLQGLNFQRYSARSNYLFSSDAPWVIYRSLCDTCYTVGGRCILIRQFSKKHIFGRGAVTIRVVRFCHAELPLSLWCRLSPTRPKELPPIHVIQYPENSSYLLSVSFKQAKGVTEASITNSVSAFNQSAPGTQRWGLYSQGNEMMSV